MGNKNNWREDPGCCQRATVSVNKPDASAESFSFKDRRGGSAHVQHVQGSGTASGDTATNREKTELQGLPQTAHTSTQNSLSVHSEAALKRQRQRQRHRLRRRGICHSAKGQRNA
eukprot:746613-Hanusia_phi.AAC.1